MVPTDPAVDTAVAATEGLQQASRYFRLERARRRHGEAKVAPIAGRSRGQRFDQYHLRTSSIRTRPTRLLALSRAVRPRLAYEKPRHCRRSCPPVCHRLSYMRIAPFPSHLSHHTAFIFLSHITLGMMCYHRLHIHHDHNSSLKHDARLTFYVCAFQPLRCHFFLTLPASLPTYLRTFCFFWGYASRLSIHSSVRPQAKAAKLTPCRQAALAQYSPRRRHHHHPMVILARRG